MGIDRRGADDPKGLIDEAYRIDGIGASECRSIFLDWALGHEGEAHPAIRRLLDGRPAHPMTDVLQAAFAQAPRPGRRGGRAARVGG